MRDIVNLEEYPLDRPSSSDWTSLVAKCQAELKRDGLFNLPGFIKEHALSTAISEVESVFSTRAFTHTRVHNIYFKDRIDGLSENHPALRTFQTVNHTICADQMQGLMIIRLYEWPQFRSFLAAVMQKQTLYLMEDPLARVNVMSYRQGEALNWHFDRSEFTTTLLLQSPEKGGIFEYRTGLRTETEHKL